MGRRRDRQTLRSARTFGEFSRTQRERRDRFAPPVRPQQEVRDGPLDRVHLPVVALTEALYCVGVAAAPERHVRDVVLALDDRDRVERATEPTVERPETGAVDSEVEYRPPVVRVEDVDSRDAGRTPRFPRERVATAGGEFPVVGLALAHPLDDEREAVAGAAVGGEVGLQFLHDCLGCGRNRCVQTVHVERHWTHVQKRREPSCGVLTRRGSACLTRQVYVRRVVSCW